MSRLLRTTIAVAVLGLVALPASATSSGVAPGRRPTQ